MDATQCMIVDLEHRGEKRMFMTERIEKISEKSQMLWAVKFTNTTRVFNYNRARLLYLQNPERIDIDGKGLYVNNVHISDASQVLKFTDGRHTFYHIIDKKGHYEDFEGKEVYITRTRIDEHCGGTWNYLKKLAAETGLIAEDEENILSKQYDLVDVMRDNVPLAQYLGSRKKLKHYPFPDEVYYPFGCNASQKKAVEAAMTHQVSIIQGPPGTGKTQTILNIISNLIMNGKNVLVVSNNNSAVENVAEKLSEVELGFIVAQLGSVQHKESFIAHQPAYPDMSQWEVEHPSMLKGLASEALKTVAKGFDSQLREARLKAEYDALLKEKSYNESTVQSFSEKSWLKRHKTSKLLTLLHGYQKRLERGLNINFWFRLRAALTYAPQAFYFLKGKPVEIVSILEQAYYSSREKELKEELKAVSDILKELELEDNLKNLRSTSLLLLKHRIAHSYKDREREVFTLHGIKSKTEEFLKEYPIVLSTTYSAKSCIDKNRVFDYVIMDEASQVDIKTGVLALSCAMNAVIVGDDKQLPNVVSQEERSALEAIQATYRIDDRYCASTHSFLQSCSEVFSDVPVTLLREHYRCHPRIIEFCNQRFYDGELIPMTKDGNEKKVLQIFRTVPGNHARGHFNQREIDVIQQEVLPQYSTMGSIGIITPYRTQALEINKALHSDIASTVHKYQGRECDTIIMSMVDNQPTEFSDDPNLMNVAISRAKSHLCIVINGNEMPEDSNLAQLIAYMQYHNFEVSHSRLHSVFDLLYKQYTAERLAYETSHRSVSGFLSENLAYNVLLTSIKKSGRSNLDILCHYPLSRLISDWSLLDPSEKEFAESPFSHVDFLIYNTVTKQPLRAIEIDGWKYHVQSEVQQSRDALKDRILSRYGLKPKRISTTEILNEDTFVM